MITNYTLLSLLLAACAADSEFLKDPHGPDTGRPSGPESEAGPEPGDDTGPGVATGPADDTAGSVDTAGTVDTGGVELDTTYSCSAIGSSYTDGFFALAAYAGQLYAGLFGYGHESQSMLVRYPSWELVSPGLLGISESVCAMTEYEGRLYANTESSGDIYRSDDGENWTQVYNGGDHTIGCGLESLDGYLYAVNYDNRDRQHGRILRSRDGSSWETVWDSGSQSRYLREITSHDGVLYAFGVDESDHQGWMLSSTNGTSWTATPTETRFFRAHSWGGQLWVASTDRSSHGEAGIWRFDGAEFHQVHRETKHYVTEITDFNGALFAGTSDGWKTDEGTSSLLMSEDGESWETVCTFPEIAAWSLARLDDHLYVGTWQYGDGGQVYEVSAVEAGR